MTRLCEYVGQKMDEIIKNVLYLLSSSEKGITQNNWYNIPLNKNDHPFELFYFLKFTKWNNQKSKYR